MAFHPDYATNRFFYLLYNANTSGNVVLARYQTQAGNPNLADKAKVIHLLVNGRGGMPWFTDMLSAEQIAAVLTFVRSDFNAYADPVTAAEVQAAIGSASAE